MGLLGQGERNIGGTPGGKKDGDLGGRVKKGAEGKKVEGRLNQERGGDRPVRISKRIGKKRSKEFTNSLDENREQRRRIFLSRDRKLEDNLKKEKGS